MALNQGTVLDEIRDMCAAVSGVEAAFSESSDALATSLPPALGVFPCLMVMSGPTRDYNPQVKRHTYEVRVWVLVQPAHLETAGPRAMPFTVRIIDATHNNVILDGAANWCVFDRASGLIALEWNGVEYLGHEIILVVSEHDSTDIAEA